MARRAIELHRTRVRTTIEMGRALSAYAADPADYDADGLKKHVKPDTARHLEGLVARLEALPGWTAGSTEAALRDGGGGRRRFGGQADPPGAPRPDRRDRRARRSSTSSELLGKETSLRRLRAFLTRAAAVASATGGQTS